MKLIDMTVTDFANEVDSNSPAPGGGSVSALASDIGVGLARMMAHLSFGKKKFEALDDATKAEFKSRFDKSIPEYNSWSMNDKLTIPSGKHMKHIDETII